jgi:excisionase family DNA binding protein
MNAADQVEPLWTAADVARFLNCSRKSVYRGADSGEIPCVRFGGLLRFDPAVIRARVRGEASAVAQVLPLKR